MRLGFLADPYMDPFSQEVTMWSAKALKRYGVVIALTAVATMIPVSVSTSGEAKINDACADGACCKELASLCGDYLDHYYSLSGRCTIRVTPSETAKAPRPDADA